jgi:hypothetical protein
VSYEGPERDQVSSELIGNMDRRRLESTDECHVQSVAVVVGRKTNDVTFSVPVVRLAPSTIVREGAALVGSMPETGLNSIARCRATGLAIATA